MIGERHYMSDAEWQILRSELPHKHQYPERLHDRRMMATARPVRFVCARWIPLPYAFTNAAPEPWDGELSQVGLNCSG